MKMADKIAKRWGFPLPESYWKLQKMGLIQQDPYKSIMLEGHWWLPVEKIAIGDGLMPLPDDMMMPGFVPVAKAPNGDLYCWHQHQESSSLFYAQCPHDCDTALGYAQDIEGFIYRHMLEHLVLWAPMGPRELTASTSKKLLEQVVNKAIRVLPADWGSTLQSLLKRPRKRVIEEYYGNISREESQELIQRDLAFPMLDQPIQWHIPYRPRSRRS